MTDVLIEVGTEEIPARMMPEALDRLRERFRNWLERRHFVKNGRSEASSVEFEVHGTPRRLVIHGELPDKQNDRTETVKGPPEHVAFDDGEPTQALEGFCSQHGLVPDDVEVTELDGGQYVVAEIHHEGQPLEDCLREDLETLILGMDWPKSMRWEDSGTQFIRPIRWACVLLDNNSVKIDIGPVTASADSRGLRFTEHENFRVNSINQYHDSGPYDSPGGEPYLPGYLLDEVTHLVEYPTPFLGKFDEKFLGLPDEVLKESMISHQKYIPVTDENDNLKPYFIGVRNGGEKDLEVVRRGNERVLRARLNDAVFFYEKDLETPYEEYREHLKGVVFQEELGHLYDKSERLASLCRQSSLDADDVDLEQVARHCKNDHVTEMVEEFPKLQGTMGRIYASETAGWDVSTARVIENHYKPEGRDDNCPNNFPSACLGIIDRVDTLVGFFGMGHRVTGSSDPYGLRRDVLGIIRLIESIEEGPITIDLKDLIDRSRSLYEEYDVKVKDEDIKELLEFIRARQFQWYREDLDEFHDDVVNAVLETCYHRPAVARLHIEWIQNHLSEPDFQNAYTAAQRICNISSDQNPSAPSEDLFEKDVEARLWKEYCEMMDSVDTEFFTSAHTTDEYVESLATYVRSWADLKATVDEFFDRVMVMAEDQTLRSNRLGMLASMREDLERVADFSQVHEVESVAESDSCNNE
ncbi:MAG: glycine--tRNA ligase subunit beta [bacterium]